MYFDENGFTQDGQHYEDLHPPNFQEEEYVPEEDELYEDQCEDLNMNEEEHEQFDQQFANIKKQILDFENDNYDDDFEYQQQQIFQKKSN